MHDLILLRCVHCQQTIRLVVYEQSHAYVSSVLQTNSGRTMMVLPDWLDQHVAHHPAVAANEFDLDGKPGFEVITWSQLALEREAEDRAPVE